MEAAKELIESLIAARATTPTTVGSAASLAVAKLGILRWASRMADIRVTLPFDDTQMVMFVAVNNHLGLAIADSGAYQTVMDHRMAQAFGLCVRHTVNGEYVITLCLAVVWSTTMPGWWRPALC